MPDTMTREAPRSGAGTSTYDAVIIGAGFSGMYQLHLLRDRLGLSVRVLEQGGGVGGRDSLERVVARAGAAAGSRDVDAVRRRSGIQFRFCRPAVLLELCVVPSADARDECAWRRRGRARGNRRLKLRDREGALLARQDRPDRACRRSGRRIALWRAAAARDRTRHVHGSGAAVP